MKKIFLMLSIIILFTSIFMIFPLSKNDNVIKNENKEMDTNSIVSVNEILDTDNKTIPNIATNDEQTIELENNAIDISQSKAQEKTLDDAQVTKKAQEVPKTKENTPVVKQTEKSTTKKVEEQQTQKTTTAKVETKTQETTVSNTKEETSKTETPTQPETTTKQENTQTNTKKDETPSTPTEPVDTIKRISTEQLQAEKSKYLQDIQSVKPGLTYKEAKRGQVFWPYRTSEIEIAVGGVSFGTVYYYVDIFVEDNQEKFKYYIDWAGE